MWIIFYQIFIILLHFCFWLLMITKYIYIYLLLILVLILFKMENLCNYYLNNIRVSNLSSKKDNNKFFFFEKNQDELKYCDNYGVFVYDFYYYLGGKIREYPSNLGDYIQSLAAIQYLPKNCKPYLVDRDMLRFYHGPKIKLIMNGWHLIHDGNNYISSQIKPIFLSFHLNRFDTSTDYIKKLKLFSPIGCRDNSTRDKLIKYGINAYFSSCLTTTLDIDYASNEKIRTDEIIFIDYKLGDYPEADEYIQNMLFL